MAQVVKNLSRKNEALSSNPVPPKGKELVLPIASTQELMTIQKNGRIHDSLFL
jgi:hypothetical protein